MKKITVLFLSLLTVVGVASAQSQQELLEAYRNGTLTQSQLNTAKQSASNVRRTRQGVNAQQTDVQSAAQAQGQDGGGGVQSGGRVSGRYARAANSTLAVVVMCVPQSSVSAIHYFAICPSCAICWPMLPSSRASLAIACSAIVR